MAPPLFRFLCISSLCTAVPLRCTQANAYREGKFPGFLQTGSHAAERRATVRSLTSKIKKIICLFRYLCLQFELRFYGNDLTTHS